MLEPIQKVSLTDSIIKQLISYIQTDLKLGQKLPSERTLIEILGVGRTSLRESLRAIEMLGYVETRAGEGTYVIQNQGDFLKKSIELGVFSSNRSLKETYEARRVIEIGMIPLILENITGSELLQCKSFLLKMEQEGVNNHTRFLDYDNEFHKVIASSTKNETVAEVHKLTSRIIEEVGKSSQIDKKQIRKSIVLHKQIVDAIEDRDEKRVKAAVIEHMELTRNLLGI